MGTGTSDGLRVFDGGVAVVTGGASGIGQALAEELANRGCEVILADLCGGVRPEITRWRRQEQGGYRGPVFLEDRLVAEPALPISRDPPGQERSRERVKSRRYYSE